MQMNWLIVALFLCVVVQIGLVIWGPNVKSDGLRMVRVAVAIVLAGLATATAFQAYERSHTISGIQSRLDALKVRQLDLKARFDALLAESAKAPNDPVLLKSLGTRHLELAKEDEALKKDVDAIQKELTPMNK